jgi:hypothetical protein
MSGDGKMMRQKNQLERVMTARQSAMQLAKVE